MKKIFAFLAFLMLVPAALAFSDTSGHKYEEAIEFIEGRGIVEGYSDGSYRPDSTVNRAELLKIIVEAVYDDEFEDFEGESCFTDVKAGLWYSKYVCFAQSVDMVEGYPNGSFQPSRTVNYVEALKIVMIGFGYEYVEGTPWYGPLSDTAGNLGFIADDITAPDLDMSRANMAELITRILKYNDGELSAYLGLYEPETLSEYRENLLELINEHRANQGLSALSENSLMSEAAQDHSEWMDANSTLSHVGEGGSRAWDRCEDVGTECSAENAAKHIYPTAQNMFVQWKNSSAHNAIMLEDWTEIGIGREGDYSAVVFE